MFSWLNKNKYVDVTLKSYSPHIGFTTFNNYTNQLSGVEGNTWSDILYNLNQFRQPNDKIRQIFTSIGNPIPLSQQIKQGDIAYIDKKNKYV